MASVVKRGNTYRVSVFIGRTPEGKMLRKTTTWKPAPGMTAKQEKKALDRFVIEYEEKVRTGQSYSGDKMTVYRFSDMWMEEYVAANLSPNTQENYRRILDKHILPEIGHFPISSITPMHITSLYNKMTANGLAPSSVQRYHHLLSSMFHTAQKWMVIPSNPCDAATVPKNRRPQDIKFFTDEEAKRFLNALDSTLRLTAKGEKREFLRYYHEDTQNRLLFTLAVYGGFRRGEMVALTWKDINFKNSTVSITKEAAYTPGKGVYIKEPKTQTSNRTVSLPESVMSLFRTWKVEQEERFCNTEISRSDSSFVFVQANGKMMHPDTPSKSFKRFLSLYNQSVEENKDLTEEEKKSLYLPSISLHGLRHTSATLLLSLGVDPITVAKRLGHASASTTLNVYAHALEKQDEKAGKALEDLLS